MLLISCGTSIKAQPVVLSCKSAAQSCERTLLCPGHSLAVHLCAGALHSCLATSVHTVVVQPCGPVLCSCACCALHDLFSKSCSQLSSNDHPECEFVCHVAVHCTAVQIAVLIGQQGLHACAGLGAALVLFQGVFRHAPSGACDGRSAGQTSCVARVVTSVLRTSPVSGDEAAD